MELKTWSEFGSRVSLGLMYIQSDEIVFVNDKSAKSWKRLVGSACHLQVNVRDDCKYYSSDSLLAWI